MAWFSRHRGQEHALAGRVALDEPPSAQARTLWPRGRRTSGKPYLIPAEDERIAPRDLEHYVLRQALRRNICAPVRWPDSLLAVAAEPDRWAREMAETFPDANVADLGIVPSAAGELPPPENYAFIPVRIPKEGFPFASGSFAYMHLRFLLGALSEVDRLALLQEAARVTQPGGWIEAVERALPRGVGEAAEQCFAWEEELTPHKSTRPLEADALGVLVRKTGLRQVTVREITPAIGRRGGRSGALLYRAALARLERLREPVIERGIASAEAYDVVAARALLQLASGRAVQPYIIAYGRRSLTP